MFFKQNNGFLIAYTAITDALMLKNCAVMWRWKEQEIVETVRLKGVTDMQVAMKLQELQDSKPEVVEASDPVVSVDQMGEPVSTNHKYFGIIGQQLQLYRVALIIFDQ